jgi:2-polyprenyl-6-methoxyphenol hydroxylase-like FAD-dependent oxidoreductase
MWVRGRRKARIPFEEMGKDLSPFPFVLMLGQDDNERIMGDRLRSWNVGIQWNTELIGLEQQSSHVTATIKDPDGRTRTLEAAYVAGCDGGRSAVRELNHIGFPGAPYEHSFFVADTVATGPMVPNELNVYLWPTGFHLYFPMKGTNGWRVIGLLPQDLETRSDLTFDDLVPSLRQEGGAVTFTACHWFSTYRIQHRRTERFRDRRCFLLGDAAHVHSPMGGQGMNTGLQDAYNLGWKLGLVVSGRADGALLDSYEAERLPVADRLLSTTDRAFRFVVSDSWFGGVFRTQVFPNVAALAMRQERVRKAAFRTISQIGIAYRESPLSRTLSGVTAHAPQAGDRFPWLRLTFQGRDRPEDLFQRLDDTRFNLLAFGQPAPMVERLGLGDLLQVHVVPFEGENAAALKTVSITAPAFYLLRPDGHVALAGTQLENAALERWFLDAHVHPGRPSAHTVENVVSVR